jgi:tetratricopeptide (TPR) repeat protein
MVVRNEVEVVAESLESLCPAVDEVLILDTGSTDGTLELAERFGARVVQRAWKNSFAIARNQLLEEVRGGWILWVDAGERITGDSGSQLRAFVDDLADPGCVYSLAVDIPSSGEGGSVQRALLPRLMYAQHGLQFHGRVRETLEPTMRSCGLRLARAPGRIIRHIREHEQERIKARAERNLQLVDFEEAEGRPLSARLLIAKGEALSELGDQGGACQTFLQALDRASPRSTVTLEAYYGLLVSLDSDSSRLDWQLHVCRDALDTFPDDAQLLCSLGNYMHARNRLDLAGCAFRTAALAGQIHESTWHLAEILPIAAVCLSITQELQGKENTAIRDLERSLESNPDSRRILQRLADLYVKQGLEEQAIRAADRLWPDHARNGAACSAARGACAAARANWASALEQLQSAYKAGLRHAFCLRWLCVTLLLSGQVEAAEPILSEWLDLEPDNQEAHKYLEVIQGRRVADTLKQTSQEARQFRIDAAKPGAAAFPIHSPRSSRSNLS